MALLLAGCALLSPPPPPSPPAKPVVDAGQSYERALDFYRRQQYDAARRELSRLIAQHPTAAASEAALYLLGEAYSGEGWLRAAAGTFEDYLRRYPNGSRAERARERLTDCLAELQQRRLQGLSPAAKFAAAGKAARRHQAQLSWYGLAEEKEALDLEWEDLRDPQGEYLATVPVSFYRRLIAAGNGRLRGGHLVSWADRDRFLLLGSGYPFGRSAYAIPLIPLRSVAVDPQTIPIGTSVYIAAFDGLSLPGGEVHDGCFLAHDIVSGKAQTALELFIPQPSLAQKVMSNVPPTLEISIEDRHCPANHTGWKMLVTDLAN